VATAVFGRLFESTTFLGSQIARPACRQNWHDACQVFSVAACECNHSPVGGVAVSESRARVGASLQAFCRDNGCLVTHKPYATKAGKFVSGQKMFEKGGIDYWANPRSIDRFAETGSLR
jgi:hypothetical protein